MPKITVYTSYFDKMAERKKSDDDIYIQVSRSVSCQKKDLNGIAVTSEIDSNYGEWFGNNSGNFIPEYGISECKKDIVYRKYRDV